MPLSSGEECDVCCITFNANQRRPLILPICGHTFCHRCLQTLYEKQPNFQCPMCRQHHTGLPISELKMNFKLMSLIETDQVNVEMPSQPLAQPSRPQRMNQHIPQPNIQSDETEMGWGDKLFLVACGAVAGAGLLYVTSKVSEAGQSKKSKK